jgi:phosphotransferase system HPr-like phosphotransfer protein
MLNEIATIQLTDAETHDDAIAIVRRDENRVALSLSVRKGSDVQIVMTKTDARALLEALKAAVL